MKKVTIVLGIIGLLLIAGITQTKAQLSISVNIGSQPTWGPVGYDRADYYYLPDVESYYSVSNHQFIYLSNGRWTFSASLPGRYANYDLNSGYKVVVNRPRPYLNFNQDRVTYGKYKGWHGKQQVIRDSRDEKYKGNKHDNRGDNNGRGNDYGRGSDNQGNQNYNNGGDKGHGNQGDKGHGNGGGKDKGNKHGDN
jgi:hypothetical protein